MTPPPTPITSEVADNIRSQIEGSLDQTLPLLPKAFIDVLSKVLAGLFIILWKYAGFTWQQMFVEHASFDETTVNGRTIRPLVEWGRLIGIGDPVPSEQAVHTIEITVNNQAGELPARTPCVFPDTGVVYLTQSPVALNDSTVTVQIRATEAGAGTIGNLDSGNVVFFANPLPNISQAAVVQPFDSNTDVEGIDAETEEAYRARVIRRFQRLPQGGAYADYQMWATEPGAVLNAYPYTSDVPGEVDVYVESVASHDEDGVPSSALLATVEDHINFENGNGIPNRRPANARVNVLPISRVAVDVVLENIQGVDDLDAVEAQIEEGLDDYLRFREPFILGLSVMPRMDRITRSALLGIAEDVVGSQGGTIDGLTISVLGIERQAYTLEHGEKAKVGNVS